MSTDKCVAAAACVLYVYALALTMNSVVAPYSSHHVIPLPRSASVSPSFAPVSPFALRRAHVYRVFRAKESDHSIPNSKREYFIFLSHLLGDLQLVNSLVFLT